MTSIPTISLADLEEGIRRSFHDLLRNDGSLIGLPERPSVCSGEPRDLHEVCINHKLSNYFERHLLTQCRNSEDFYCDIEFNRDEDQIKILDGKAVRLDIILHDRKTTNVLIAECKKTAATNRAKKKDMERIQKMMRHPKYNYAYGLFVEYLKGEINGTLFYVPKI